MKYKAVVVIELDEDRKTCLDCPFCNTSDSCQLQDLGETETWSEQLVGCPLEKLESEGE